MKFFKLFIMLFLLSFVNFCFAQSTNLSKQQMQQDISFLANAIKEIDPNLLVRQAVTGTNLYQELDSLVNLSNDISSFDNFYMLANKLLQLTQDQHHQFVDYYPFEINEKNPYITTKNIDFSKNIFQQYEEFLPCCGGFFSIKYIDGNYFNIENLYTETDTAEKNVLMPAGAKLLKINDIPIDKYVNDFLRPVDNTVRWDMKRKKYYTLSIHHPFYSLKRTMEAFITYEMDNKTETVEYKNTSVVGYNPMGDFSVQYFETDKILYIRIPSMDYEKINFLTTEIQKYKSQKINKVIIDIRYNGGGTDEVWSSVLSAIIKKTLKIKSNVYLKNTPIVRDYITNICNEKITKTLKINEIEYIDVDTTNFDIIKPSENSLNYNGKIYVLVNEKIFSSSLAFVSVCKQVKNFVTVGVSTGYICGRSTTPFFLSLPNSKLIFELVPCIDMTNKKKSIDYYDMQAEIPVCITVDDYIKEVNNSKQLYTKDFLYNHDPVF
ncbi:MAG: S41 family peptidase [Prevotellaceae bacterium]|nr:S41 family peptidase [Prevotellaceae bacterium]